jgi:hypothetical protein
MSNEFPQLGNLLRHGPVVGQQKARAEPFPYAYAYDGAGGTGSIESVPFPLGPPEQRGRY